MADADEHEERGRERTKGKERPAPRMQAPKPTLSAKLARSARAAATGVHPGSLAPPPPPAPPQPPRPLPPPPARHDRPDKAAEVLLEVKHCEGRFAELRQQGAPDEGPSYADADAASQVFQAVAPVGACVRRASMFGGRGGGVMWVGG